MSFCRLSFFSSLFSIQDSKSSNPEKNSKSSSKEEQTKSRSMRNILEDLDCKECKICSENQLKKRLSNEELVKIVFPNYLNIY